MEGMERMQKNHLIFGASVTVTRENLCEVFSYDFVKDLGNRGCRVVFYVEYVPVSAATAGLAPTDEERRFMEKELAELRRTYPEMIFISFPGDEKSSGGCLAAGRGFFHINSHGGAEPCPFSPYSDSNVRDTSLREALRSELFRALRRENILTGEHSGGCVLFEQKEKVEEIIYRNDFGQPLTTDAAGKLFLPLEMVRLAPSAVNKQPWRMVVTDDAVHFYLQRSKGFGGGKLDMQKVDLGIALCHFELMAKELGINTEFSIMEPDIPCGDGTEYIASYRYKI